MIETIILDLAEVYLQGMIGAEYEISRKLNIDETAVMPVHLAGEKRTLLFEGKISEEEYWKRVIEENNYPTTVEGYNSTLEFLKSAIRRNFKKIPGTEDIILALKKSGYKLALLSDHAREWIDYCESQFPLKDLFQIRCYSFDIECTKHSPESFLYALKTSHANPKTTLIVDDKKRNLDMAKSRLVKIKYVHLFIDAPSFEKSLLDFGINLSTCR